MCRKVFLVVICLRFVCVDDSIAQEPFNSETAVEAQRVYEAALAKAKADYVAQLDVAIKEAGAAGDLEEANRISVARKEVNSSGVSKEDDPVAKVRKQLEGTRWGPGKDETIRFHEGGQAVFNKGYPVTWILSDPRTLILQSDKSSNISVWQFDKK